MCRVFKLLKQRRKQLKSSKPVFSKSVIQRLEYKQAPPEKYDLSLIEKPYDPSRFYNRGTHPIKRFVLHWNGADISASQFVERKRDKGFFYDYVIGRHGVVYSVNPDLTKYASKHVRGNNYWTVGICLIGPGYHKERTIWDWKEETIHGRDKVHMVFTDDQKKACSQLIRYIHPKILNSTPKVATEPNVLSAEKLDQYTITGHFHHQKNRRDPGLNILFHLQEVLEEVYVRLPL